MSVLIRILPFLLGAFIGHLIAVAIGISEAKEAAGFFFCQFTTLLFAAHMWRNDFKDGK